MAIRADSRYANGELVVVTLPNGQSSRMLWQAPLTVEDVPFQYYMIVEGERLDTLASRIYGDPTVWWTIADMNPELLWPGALIPGTLMRVPLPNAADASPATQTVMDVIDV